MKTTENDLLGLVDYLRDGALSGIQEEWFTRCANWVEEKIK